MLIIGIDGCRPDALLQAKTPNLKALIRDGAFSDKAQTGDITLSGPGWTSLLTGVWRQKHGVRDNEFEGANLRAYPHLFRRVKEKLPGAKTASIVHWEPINTRIVSGADLVKTFAEDRRVAEEAERVLKDTDSDIVSVHFDDVDHAGHRYDFDPKVEAYRRAIEQTDVYVGRLVKAVRERKTYRNEDWLTLVSTDHGGSDGGHGKNIPEHRTIFLIVSGPSAVRGKIEPAPQIVDLAPTALTHLGIAIDPKWSWDGKPVGLRSPRRTSP